MCITTALWLSKPFATIARKTARLRMGQANAFWVLFATLIFFTRLPIFFQGLPFSIATHYTYVAFLLPATLFLYNWSLIRAIYIAGKSQWIAIAVSLILGALLVFI